MNSDDFKGSHIDLPVMAKRIFIDWQDETLIIVNVDGKTLIKITNQPKL